jgi:hypothetical protein
MAKYLVLEGEHREGLGEDLRVYVKGDVFDSPHEMDKLFRGKFRKVTSMAQAKKINLGEEGPEAASQDTAEVKLKESRGIKNAAPSRPRAAVDVPGDVPEGGEEEDEEGEEPDETAAALEKKHGKDVTKEFQDAADNDLVVRRGKKGAVVMDGEKVLNSKPFKSKAEVNKFLKGHLSDKGASDGASGKDDE